MLSSIQNIFEFIWIFRYSTLLFLLFFICIFIHFLLLAFFWFYIINTNYKNIEITNNFYKINIFKKSFRNITIESCSNFISRTWSWSWLFTNTVFNNKSFFTGKTLIIEPIIAIFEFALSFNEIIFVWAFFTIMLIIL